MFGSNELFQSDSIPTFPPFSVPVKQEGYNPNIVSSIDTEGTNTGDVEGTWEVFWKVFNVNDPNERAELEKIHAGCLNGQYTMLKESSNWDQVGYYKVALSWGAWKKKG